MAAVGTAGCGERDAEALKRLQGSTSRVCLRELMFRDVVFKAPGACSIHRV